MPALLFAVAAGASLAILSVFGTLRYHERHRKLLGTCFLTLAGSSVCKSMVYGGVLRNGRGLGGGMALSLSIVTS